VNPSLKLRTTEPGLTEFLAAHPALAPAIERAKGKIEVKARKRGTSCLGKNRVLFGRTRGRGSFERDVWLDIKNLNFRSIVAD
jgi:hypothetical protein